ADRRDVALQGHQLVLVARHPPDAEQLGLEGVAVLDDRDDGLAREVAAVQDGVGLVDPQADGVQHLAPRLVRGVDVRHDLGPRSCGPVWRLRASPWTSPATGWRHWRWRGGVRRRSCRTS